jgi:hypothetical protein
MSESTSIVPAPRGADVPSPTETRYALLAAAFMKAIDDIAAVIPPLDPAMVKTAKFVRGHQNVPDRFCETVLNAVEQVPALQGVGALDTVAGRDTLQFLSAFRPALDKGEALQKALFYIVMGRKAALATQALQIYGVARSISRDPANSQVAAHFEAMQRDLGRKGLTKAQRELRKAIKKAAAEVAEKEVKTA